MRRRRPVLRPRALGALAVAISLLTAGFVAWSYNRFIAYSPRAQLYVPADAEWSLHIDVERVQLFEPLRAHGLPLLNALLRASAGSVERGGGVVSPAKQSPLASLKSRAGFDLSLGLREVAAAGGTDGDLVLAFGGKFPERFTPGDLNAVLYSGRLPLHTDPPLGVALGFLGGLVSRPESGVWLWASDRPALSAAEASAQHVPEPAAGTPSPSGEAVLEIRKRQAQSVGEALGIESLESIRVQLSVARHASVEAQLRLSSRAASHQWVARWGATGWPGSGQSRSSSIWAPLRPLLARAQVRSTEGATVRLASHLTRAELDALAEAAALLWTREVGSDSVIGLR